MTTPMDEDRIREIEAQLENIPAGPWQWFGNTKHSEVYLATVHGGRVFVMDFVRWGMCGAQPRFQVGIEGREGSGFMRTLAELTAGGGDLGVRYEVPYRKQFVGIGHPAARFLAESRALVDELLAEVKRLRADLDTTIEERNALLTDLVEAVGVGAGPQGDANRGVRAEEPEAVKRCKHRRVFARLWSDSAALPIPWIVLGGDPAFPVKVDARVCADCRAWLGLGRANDRGVEVEIAAARLIAGYEDASDTADTLDDPVCFEVIEHMVGDGDLRTRKAKDVFQIHESHRGEW